MTLREYPQPPFVREFIDEIERTRGGALAGIIPPPTREQLGRDFLAIARRAALDTLGGNIEVEVTEPLGELVFFKRDGEGRELVDYATLPTDPSYPLWPRLTEDLNRELLRYLPGPVYRHGTLAELLSQGGGFTRGLSVTSGNIEICVDDPTGLSCSGP